jgi:hypothetical protein
MVRGRRLKQIGTRPVRLFDLGGGTFAMGATGYALIARNTYNAVRAAALDSIKQWRSELGRPETSIVHSAS